MSFDFCLLGAKVVVSDRDSGEELVLRAKEQQVLALLAIAAHQQLPVSRHELQLAEGDLVHGDGERPPRADNATQKTVSNLRGRLGSDRLPDAGASGYRLMLAPNDTLDVADFLSESSRVLAEPTLGRGDTQIAARLVDNLRGGPFGVFAGIASLPRYEARSRLSVEILELHDDLIQRRDGLRQLQSRAGVDPLRAVMLCTDRTRRSTMEALVHRLTEVGWVVTGPLLTTRMHATRTNDVVTGHDVVVLDVVEDGTTAVLAGFANQAGTAVIVVHPDDAGSPIAGAALELWSDELTDPQVCRETLRRFDTAVSAGRIHQRKRRQLLAQLDSLIEQPSGDEPGDGAGHAMLHLASGLVESLADSLRLPTAGHGFVIDHEAYSHCFAALTRGSRDGIGPANIAGVVDMRQEAWGNFWADAPSWMVTGVAYRCFTFDLEQFLDIDGFAAIARNLQRHVRQGREENPRYRMFIGVAPLAADLGAHPLDDAVDQSVLVVPSERLVSGHVVDAERVRRAFRRVTMADLERGRRYVESIRDRCTELDGTESAADVRRKVCAAAGLADWPALIASHQHGAYDRAMSTWVPHLGTLRGAVAGHVLQLALSTRAREERPVRAVELGTGSGAVAQQVAERAATLGGLLLDGQPLFASHHAIDRSVRMIEQAGTRLAPLGVDVRRGRVEDGPAGLSSSVRSWSDGLPDVVYGTWALHELAGPSPSVGRLVDAVRAVSRFGRPGSSLVFAGPLLGESSEAIEAIDWWREHLRRLGLAESAIADTFSAAKLTALTAPPSAADLGEAAAESGYDLVVTAVVTNANPFKVLTLTGSTTGPSR